jgi:hypothetical protein
MPSDGPRAIHRKDLSHLCLIELRAGDLMTADRGAWIAASGLPLGEQPAQAGGVNVRSSRLRTQAALAMTDARDLTPKVSGAVELAVGIALLAVMAPTRTRNIAQKGVLGCAIGHNGQERTVVHVGDTADRRIASPGWISTRDPGAKSLAFLIELDALYSRTISGAAEQDPWKRLTR